MGLMSLAGWLEASTQASGVPLKVSDDSVLLDAATLIVHTGS